MIVGLSVENFKGIQKLDRLRLDSFHVLVGPNGSGKSTFLDAIDFVRSCLQHGPARAVEERVPDYRDLTFMRRGGPIQIGFYLDLSQSPDLQTDLVLHYHLVIREDERLGVSVEEETLEEKHKQVLSRRASFFTEKAKPRRLLGKTSKGSDFYQREDGKYMDSFAFGLDKLTLSLTPPDEKRYPTANGVKRFLMQGIRYFQLNSRAMREPCPATRPTELELDGTNLARVVGRLKRTPNGNSSITDSDDLPSNRLRRWTEHLQYALEDLQEIGWSTRQADNAEFIVLRYKDGLECPSWLVSDGTLRMLALTLPAFLPSSPSIYMVEEPENGVHPRAIEVILRALAAIPGAQTFIATHSPLVVQEVGIDPLLCFARDERGVRIISGKNHPALKEWKGTPELSSIFASRVLG